MIAAVDGRYTCNSYLSTLTHVLVVLQLLRPRERQRPQWIPFCNDLGYHIQLTCGIRKDLLATVKIDG